MSDQCIQSPPAGVLVEVHTLFVASDQAEANAVLDRVLDAASDAVCPPSAARLVVCGHCAGSLVNPACEEDGGTEIAANDPSAPGLPCAMCADTDHPGKEMVCSREHASGATFHLDGLWLSAEDRRLASLLRRLLVFLDEGDVASVRAEVVEKLTDLAEPAATD